jgi:hypothetical protein
VNILDVKKIMQFFTLPKTQILVKMQILDKKNPTWAIQNIRKTNIQGETTRKIDKNKKKI